MNKEQSALTLICDYELRDLKNLMLARDDGSKQSDKYISLEPDEENVDFIQIFNSFHRGQ